MSKSFATSSHASPRWNACGRGTLLLSNLNGESAADAYDRISGFNEPLWQLFRGSLASVYVLVTHELMARNSFEKWYHFSVEYFEDLRNVNHCEFVIMEKNPDSRKYALQTKLRTWFELGVERELEKKRE